MFLWSELVSLPRHTGKDWARDKLGKPHLKLYFHSLPAWLLPDKEGTQRCPFQYLMCFLHGHRSPVVTTVLKLQESVFYQFILCSAAERTEVCGEAPGIDSCWLQDRRYLETKANQSACTDNMVWTNCNNILLKNLMMVTLRAAIPNLSFQLRLEKKQKTIA